MPITGASFAVLVLLLIVWIIEYSFIGRFAIVKILLCTALGSFISSFLIKKFFSGNPSRCLLLLSAQRRNAIVEGTKQNHTVLTGSILDETRGDHEINIQKICEGENVDLLVIDDEIANHDFDIVSILGSGTQVIGLLDFWQKYIGCIPPSEVNQSWLSKLDLRIMNPFALKSKKICRHNFFNPCINFSFTTTFICFLVICIGLWLSLNLFSN